MEAAGRSYHVVRDHLNQAVQQQNSAMTGKLVVGNAKKEIQYGSFHQQSQEDKQPNSTGHGGGLIGW